MKSTKTMNEKINLIYIVSNGRSGSTLLDMLLGNHSNCFTTGEFQMLPADLMFNTQPCGCGSSISSCEFWTKICLLNQPILEHGDINKFRERPNNAGRVFRASELLDTLKNHSNLVQEKYDSYGYENWRIMQDIMNLTAQQGLPISLMPPRTLIDLNG